MNDVISKKLKNRRLKPFVLSTSVKDLRSEIGDILPDESTVIKLISICGGIASLSFIKLVADFETIEELTASTLRIGRKQFMYLQSLHTQKKLNSARFFVSTMQKDVDAKKSGKYDYAAMFEKTCKKNGWKRVYVNNHSKVILMRTTENYYVLETSSNLNENPKIEQYSFENNKALYDFYYEFFERLEGLGSE